VHSIHQFSLYSHFQVTSGQMTSLLVAWGHERHFLSRDCLLRATAL